MENDRLTKLNKNEIKKIELEILKHFTNICDKYRLRYFLAGGTLLGAVRHKGFIPWDDDIDVFMPRPDFEKFIHLFEKINTNKYLKLSHPWDNREETCGYLTYLKIIDSRTVKYEKGFERSQGGIDIDVFPIDGLPKNKLICRCMFLIINCLYKITICISPYIKPDFNNKFKKSAFSLICATLQNFSPEFLNPISKKIAKLINCLARLFDYEKAEYVGQIVFPHYGIKERVRKECFNNYVYLEFENNFFKAPILYDVYLRSIYGDYMKVPKNEEIHNHGTIAFLKN